RIGEGAAPGLGPDRSPGGDAGRQRLLPDDDLLLLLRARHADPGGADPLWAPAACPGAVRSAVGTAQPRPRVKVTVLTTSYPRWPEDAAGRFVADMAEG